MEIIELLQELGFSKKHAEVFLILYKYGTSPASFIGKML
jgi:sugar-specific transcriptional regulator TrmB